MDPLAVAIEVAHEAGTLLQAYSGRPLGIAEKGARGDLVTLADRASERLIGERLRRDFPNATIWGEEGGVQSGASDERWIVDPLDGTTNFAHGYPLYCISIAYERAGDVIAGVIYAPSLQRTYAAQRGAGATCNGERIRVSTIDRVHDAMVCTGFYPSRYARNGAHFAALSERAQAVRRDGSAALDLAFVADGTFDAFWEFDLHAWDVAAGSLIVREADGQVSAIDGAPFALEAGSVLASNRHTHAEMIEALRLT